LPNPEANWYNPDKPTKVIVEEIIFKN